MFWKCIFWGKEGGLQWPGFQGKLKKSSTFATANFIEFSYFGLANLGPIAFQFCREFLMKGLWPRKIILASARILNFTRVVLKLVLTLDRPVTPSVGIPTMCMYSVVHSDWAPIGSACMGIVKEVSWASLYHYTHRKNTPLRTSWNFKYVAFHR